MSAVAPSVGKIRQLDGRAEPDEQVTTEQAQDPSRVARILMRLLRDVATIKRRWWPRFIDHRDLVVDNTGTTIYRLPHSFGTRVNWWVIDWTSTAGCRLSRDASSDDDTLALISFTSGTVSVRIEEAG